MTSAKTDTTSERLEIDVLVVANLRQNGNEPVPSVDGRCQGHSSLDAPSELNLPQKIPSPLFIALLVPQAEG